MKSEKLSQTSLARVSPNSWGVMLWGALNAGVSSVISRKAEIISIP
jgi:hypothetical protein